MWKPSRSASGTGERACGIERTKLLCTGEQTAKVVAQLLPTGKTVIVPGGVMGNVELRPGAIWSGDRMLVAGSETTVYYVVGDKLYEWWTSSFN